MVLITIVVTVVIAMILLFVAVNFPEICLAGICLRLIPVDLASQVTFWLLFISWIILQVFLIFVYFQLIRLGIMLARRGRGLLDRIVRFSDEIFRNV